MESELTHAQGHHYEASDLSGHPAALPSPTAPTGTEGNSEGKPSMMKRVRAKAKKIKNKFTGQGHDQSHIQDEGEEDEDEEMVDDPEIHSTPITEAVADDKVATRASDGQSVTGGTKLDSPAIVSPDYNSPIVDPKMRSFAQWQADEDQGKDLLNEDKHVTFPSKLVDTRSGEDINTELPKDTSTGRDLYEEKENVDRVGGRDAMEGIRGIGTTGIEVDPQSPDLRAHPSDVQIKTIDPPSRGSEEEVAEGITPVTKSFNELGITEEKTKPEQGEGGGLYTGSHNQLSPEPVPSESSDSVSESYGAANPRDIPSFESSDSVSESYGAANPRDIPSFESSDSVSKSYDAVNTRDIPSFESSDSVSKSYDAANPRDIPSFESSDSVPKTHDAVNTRDIPSFESSDSVSESYGAANPRDIPSFESSDSVSKAHDAANPRDIPSFESSDSVSKAHDAVNTRDNPSFESSDSVSKSYDAANPRDIPSFESSDSVNPRDIPSFKSSDSRDIPSFESSDSVSKSHDAANPQDIPASESSDYVPKSPNAANHQDLTFTESFKSIPKSYNAADPQDLPEDVYDPKSQSSTYTQKITSASAAAASTIAGTAQSAKNAIASKIGQTRAPGEVSEPRSVTETETEATSKVSKLGAETTQESSESVGQDKDVSGKEYSVENLNPVDHEDYKPLSEIMIESLEESKEEKIEEVPSGGGEGHGVSQIVSDVVHKREPEETEEEKPLGKVTESEEVAKRLGTEEEGSGLGSPGAGASMVSKLTGAIGSWLGGQNGAAKSAPVTTSADENEGYLGKNADAQVVSGEKRLQE